MADRFDQVYPPRLRALEWEAIRARRAALDPPGSPPAEFPRPDRDDRVGLALSGGGIRSATFCLGVLQALSERSVLSRVDLLSTVSGGGFCGSMLGGLYQRAPRPAEGAGRGGDRFVSEELGNLNSRTIRWLRENGRYLTPEGAGDWLVWVAVITRNWVALQTVLGGALLAVFSGLWLVRGVLQNWGWYVGNVETPALQAAARTGIWWSPTWPLVLGLAVVAVAPIGWGYWLTQRVRGGIALLGLVLAQLVAAWVLVEPEGAGLEGLWRLAAGVLLAAAVLAVGWWALASAIVDGPPGRSAATVAALGAGAAVVLVGVLAVPGVESGRSAPPATYVIPLLSLAGGWRLAAVQADPTAESWRQLVRTRLTKLLASMLGVSLALALLFVSDTAVQTIYLHLADTLGRSAAAGGIGATGLALLAQQVWKWVKARWPSGRPRVSTKLLAWIGSLGLAVLFLFTLSAVTVGVGLDFKAPSSPLAVNFRALGLVCLSFTLFGLLASRVFGFLNLSSQQQAYSSRLTRAYLGASNPKRYLLGAARPPGQPVEGDDIAFRDYRPDRHGGPLHLVNVTINETVSGESQVEQRDRKGLGLTLGPCGVSAGARHHAVWAAEGSGGLESVAPDTGFRVWAERAEPEALTIGRWIGISGAAFTTGTGQHTSLATSLLAGLLNVRLGYWWDSGIDPRHRPERVEPRGWARASELIGRMAPVQSALFDELLARFAGPARRHWYLSDGGHFENTAAYELIRRRVPVIVVCDCGRDPDGSSEDLAGLVRKARIDLGAEIRFWDEEALAELPSDLGAAAGGSRAIGLQSELRPSPPDQAGPRLSRCHAAIATIDYLGDHQGRRSILIVLKPSLTGDEPLDLLQYAEGSGDFPQQSTGDQFFDEVQWESYRALGYHVASNTVSQGLVEFLFRRVRGAAPAG